MKTLLYPLVLLTVLMLESCSTAYQIRQVDVLRPAAYTLPAEVRSIVLVDNSLPFRSSAVHRIESNGKISQIDSIYYDRMPVEILIGLAEELQVRGFFSEIFVDTISRKSASDQRQKALTQAERDALALQYGAQGVLSIDDYQYQTNLQVTQPEWGTYFSVLTADNKTLWRFSAIGNQVQGTFGVQKDTLFWSGDGLTPEMTVQDFPDYYTILQQLGHYAGYRFANQMTPWWESVSRIVFTKGDEYFVNAAVWAQQENWDEAMKLWGYVFQNGNLINKARAAVNLAYGSEMQGHIEEAALWCSKALDIYDRNEKRYLKHESKLVKIYFADLINRVDEQKKLNRQLPQE